MIKKENKELIEQTAVILYESFKDISEAWPTMVLARDEVYESIGEDKISRIAVNDDTSCSGMDWRKSMYTWNVWSFIAVVKREYRVRKGYREKVLVNDLDNTEG